MFSGYIWMSPERISVGEELRGRSFHTDGPKTGNARVPTVESLVRGIWRLRASEAQGVCLVQNSVLDWQPVEKLKQRCGVVRFTFFQYEASNTVRRLWTEEAGRPDQKGENCSSRGVTWWVRSPVSSHCSLGGKVLPDRTNSTELIVAGFGGFSDWWSSSWTVSCRGERRGFWLRKLNYFSVDQKILTQFLQILYWECSVILFHLLVSQLEREEQEQPAKNCLSVSPLR